MLLILWFNIKIFLFVAWKLCQKIYKKKFFIWGDKKFSKYDEFGEKIVNALHSCPRLITSHRKFSLCQIVASRKSFYNFETSVLLSFTQYCISVPTYVQMPTGYLMNLFKDHCFWTVGYPEHSAYHGLALAILLLWYK